MKNCVLACMLIFIMAFNIPVCAADTIESFDETEEAEIVKLPMSEDYNIGTNQIEEGMFTYAYARPENWISAGDGYYQMEDGDETCFFIIQDLGATFENVDDLKRITDGIEDAYTGESFNNVHIQEPTDINIGNEKGFMFDYTGVYNKEPVFGKMYFILWPQSLTESYHGILCVSIMSYKCKYNHNNDCDNVVLGLKKPGGYNADYSYEGDDFLSTMTEEEYNNYISTGQWDVIFRNASKFVEEHSDQSENSSANSIIKALEPIMEVWPEITIKYDEFENGFQAYYTGVEDLTSSIHIVPYYSDFDEIEIGKPYILLKCGFYEGDWLFFDSIKINTDKKVYLTKVGKKEEDVVNGGIFEKQVYAVDEDKITELGNLRGYKIRFSSSYYSEKNYDYNITDQEATAIESISKFLGVKTRLDQIGRGFYRNN